MNHIFEPKLVSRFGNNEGFKEDEKQKVQIEKLSKLENGVSSPLVPVDLQLNDKLSLIARSSIAF